MANNNEYIVIFDAEINLQSIDKSIKEAKQYLEKNPNATIKLKVDSNSTKSDIELLKNSFQGIGKNIKVTVDTTGSAAQINNLKNQFKEIEKAGTSMTQGLASGFKNAFQNMLEYGVAYKSFQLIQQAISGAINTAIELDKTLVDLQIVTGSTREETNALMMTYNELGREIGATTQQVAQSANDFLRQGMSMADTNTAIRSSMYLSKLGMIDSAQATQYLTSATKGYKLSADDMMGVVDKLTAVDMNAAVSAGYMAEAMARTANAADMAGVSMDKLLGYIASIGETTQRSASVVGTSISTMLARFSNVAAGNFAADGEDMENLNDIEKVFGEIGIAIRESATEMRDFDNVLADVAEQWETLSDVERNAVATAAAGTRQRESFLVLMENYNSALALEADSLNSAGTASEKYQAYQDGIEASLAQLTATFEKFVMSLNTGDTVKGLLNFANSALKVVDDFHLLNAALGVFVGLMASKVLKSITDFTKRLDNMKSATSGLEEIIKAGKFEFKDFGNSLATLNNKQKTSVINTLLQQKAFEEMAQAEIQAKLADMGLSQSQARTAATAIASAQASAADASAKTGQTVATESLKKSQLGLNAAMSANPVMLVITAITTAISLISSFAGSTKEAAENFDNLNTKLEESTSNLDNLKTELDFNKESIKELQELISDGTISEEQSREYQQLLETNKTLEDRIILEQNINDLLLKRRNENSAQKLIDLIEEEYSTGEKIANFFSKTTNSIVSMLQGEGATSNAIQDATAMLEKYQGQFQQDVKNYYDNLEDNTNKLRELEYNVLNASTEEEAAIAQAELDKLKTYLDGMEQSIADALADAEMLASAGATDIVDAIINGINKAADPEAFKQIEFDKLLNVDADGFEERINELVDVVKNGGSIMSGDVWALNRDFEEFQTAIGTYASEMGITYADAMNEFSAKLTETGVALHEAEINAALAEVSTSEFVNSLSDFSYANDALGTYADSISDIADKVNILTSAQKEFNEVGAISANTLKSLTDNNLLGYLDDVYNGTIDTANATSALEAAAKNQAMAALIQETYNKLNTVSLAQQGDAAAIATAQDMQLESALANVTSQVLSDGQAWNQATRDVSGFISLMNKNGIKMNELLKGGKYSGLVSDIYANFQTGARTIKDSSGMFKAQQISTGRSSSGSGSSSGSSKSEDTWKKAYDNELKALEHRRKMDLISEEEYLNQLEVLNNKYFAGRAEYADEFHANEEKLYDGRKKELERRMKEELDLAKERYEKEKDLLEERKDAELDAAKEIYEAQKDSVKKQQENLEKQLDSYDKIIDKRKELLDSMQEERSFQDDLTERNRVVSDLENKLAEIRYDTSAEGTKQRLQLEDELAKAMRDKEDFIFEHSVETQKEALDTEYKNYEDFINASLEKLDQELEAIEISYDETVNRIEDTFENLALLLEQTFNNTTVSIEASFKSLIDALNDSFTEYSASVTAEIGKLNSQMSSSGSGGGGSSSSSSSSSSKAYDPFSSTNSKQRETNPTIVSQTKIPSGQTAYKWSDGKVTYTKTRTFHDGLEAGFVGGVKANEEFAKLLHGELVVNPDQQNSFMDSILPKILGGASEAVSNVTNNGVNIDVAFNVMGNMDEKVVPNVRNSIKEVIDTYFVRGQRRNVRAFSV